MNIRDIVPWKSRGGPISRYDDPFSSLQTRMNSLFDDFFDRGFGHRGTFVPSIDVADKDKEVLVTAELPGIDEKDLDITVEENVLTIRGEKQDEAKEEREGYFHVERTFGSFHRSIPLPSAVDRDKVKASFKNGVLKVVLPKSEEARQRTRKVRIES